MADKHPLSEAFPCQRFRGGKTAHTYEMPFFVHQGRFTVHHIGQLASRQRMYHLLQCIVFVEAVAGIKEAEVIARSQSEAFVHGIVQAFIGFACHLCDVILITVYDRECLILRRSIHNDILHVAVGLRDNALDGIFQYRFGIVGHGNDAELGGGVVMHFFR